MILGQHSPRIRRLARIHIFRREQEFPLPRQIIDTNIVHVSIVRRPVENGTLGMFSYPCLQKTEIWADHHTVVYSCEESIVSCLVKIPSSVSVCVSHEIWRSSMLEGLVLWNWLLVSHVNLHLIQVQCVHRQFFCILLLALSLVSMLHLSWSIAIHIKRSKLIAPSAP
jgi:hypothetical protein